MLLVRTNVLQSWRRLKAIRHQSALLTFVIALFMVGYLALSFWLFLQGLQWVAIKFPGMGTMLLERLLYLLFAFLFLLLVLSNLVISYSNFFRNRETSALITLPIDTQTIFRWKLLESGLLASWAFLFLIAPFLAAYGITRHVPWHFYPFTVLLVGVFIILPSVLGCCLSTIVARYMDRRSFQIGALALATVVIAVIGFWLRQGQFSRRKYRHARDWSHGQDAHTHASRPISLAAQLLAFLERRGMDRRRAQHRGLLCPGVVEQRAFFRNGGVELHG